MIHSLVGGDETFMEGRNLKIENYRGKGSLENENRISLLLLGQLLSK